MKMITRALIMAAGFTTSLSALALAPVDNTDITGGLNGECVLLAEDVAVKLSAKVHAAFDCNEITATINFAACHEGGSRAQGTESCTQVGTNPDGTTIWSDASCADATGTYNIADYRAYVATSSGGSIGAQQLGGRCDDTTVQQVTIFQ